MPCPWPPSFNPHPPRRAGERRLTVREAGLDISRFNPHPPRRAGESDFASAGGGQGAGVSIRTRPGGRVKGAAG